MATHYQEDYFANLRQDVELLKIKETTKSNWREELAVDGIEDFLKEDKKSADGARAKRAQKQEKQKQERLKKRKEYELTKRAANFQKTREFSKAHSKQAANHIKAARNYEKHGNTRAAAEERRKAAISSGRFRAYHAKADSFKPWGSERYSLRSAPDRMNKNYYYDVKSEAGRKRIVSDN
jgi:membrane protein involved in colicin uptake